MVFLSASSLAVGSITSDDVEAEATEGIEAVRLVHLSKYPVLDACDGATEGEADVTETIGKPGRDESSSVSEILGTVGMDFLVKNMSLFRRKTVYIKLSVSASVSSGNVSKLGVLALGCAGIPSYILSIRIVRKQSAICAHT
jgi:hypothetical protein